MEGKNYFIQRNFDELYKQLILSEQKEKITKVNDQKEIIPFNREIVQYDKNNLNDQNETTPYGLLNILRTLNDNQERCLKAIDRQRIERNYGRGFAKEFIIKGLNGIARLAYPKNCFKDYQNNFKNYHDQSTILIRAVKSLIVEIFKKKAYTICINNLIKKLQLNYENHPKLMDLITELFNLKTGENWEIWNEIEDKLERKRRIEISFCLENIAKYLENIENGPLFMASILLAEFYNIEEDFEKYLSGRSRIGVLLFTSLFDDLNHFFPIYEMEIDCRGNVNLIIDKENNKCVSVISMGEIRYQIENNFNEEREQLQLRGSIIAKAHQIIVQKLHKIPLENIQIIPQLKLFHRSVFFKSKFGSDVIAEYIEFEKIDRFLFASSRYQRNLFFELK